jgi:glutamate-1-semialdehyde 2,1-aminomutase
VYPDEGSKSAALYRRARGTVADGVSRATITMDPYPLYLRSARGARVVDVDGNELIDFNNNYTSLIHGHGRAEIVAAVNEQLAKGMAYSFGSEAEVELAELLCGRLPGDQRIRFCNSGSEAVMHAIKAARAYTGRGKIAKCEGAYHGSYDFAEVSLGVGPGAWGEPAAPAAAPYAAGTPQGVLDDVLPIPFNDGEAAERILAGHGDDLAAILIDPISSLVGMVGLQPEFLATVQGLAQRLGALLIFDEVVAFRLGLSGAQGGLGVTPDLTALGKIIGGGLPIGAVAGRAEVMAVFERQGGKARLPHGGTFNANPLTMVAGRTCMELMDPGAFDRLNRMGEELRRQLREAFALANAEGQVTGEGSLFRLHLHSRPMVNYRDAWMRAEESRRMAELHRHLLNAGLFLSPYGSGCLSTAMEDHDLSALADGVLGGLRALRE